MKLGYIYARKVLGNIDLGTDPYTSLPSTLTAPGGIKPRTVGDIFFVNGFTGDNDDDGLSRDTPFLTITYALTQCANGNDDVIFVLDGWNTEPDYPILVNKTRVHIIGLNHLGGKYVALTPSTPDDPLFSFTSTGSGGEIANFSLGAGNTSPCILLNNPMDLWIHDLILGNQFHGVGTPQDGITNDGSHNASNVVIENCRFLGSPGPGRGGITRYGVYNMAPGADSFKNSVIKNCRFHNMTYAIRLVYAADALIENNYIMCPADAVVGTGIYLNGCTGLIIAKNKAGDNGTLDMTNNPYHDDAAANNAWMCNQNGITYVHPAAAL